MINSFIETCLQKQTYQHALLALSKIPERIRMDNVFFSKAAETLFNYGIECKDYKIAIAAAKFYLYYYKGQDLSAYHQTALDRLMKIELLVESDVQLKKVVAFAIDNAKKLLNSKPIANMLDW